MGLWDHIKPVAKPPAPASIEQGAQGLRILWDDQVRTEVSFRDLRIGCPCAVCVEEWTGRRTVDPAQVAADVQASSLSAVGNYALSVVFSDGHSTGIYSWATLRGLGAVEG